MRIKRSVNALKKRRAILKQAKGYRGAKTKRYRVAREAVMKNFYNCFFVLIRINFELLINWWEGWKFKWRDMPLSK